MKYLALVYYQESAMNQMSQQECDALNRECIACVGSLQQSGNFLDGAPLEQSPSATTIRVRDDKLLVTDGPFAETKEQLAGYYLLEANDLNQAIQLAQKIPPARYGSVEIRPLRELQEEGNSGHNAVN